MDYLPHNTRVGRTHDAGLRGLERALLLLGLALVAFYIAARLDSLISARMALWAFNAAQPRFNLQKPALDAVSELPGADMSLWSLQRIDAYKVSFVLSLNRPAATLSLPRLGLIAPIFEGTDSITLNRGLGRIPGTAQFGEDGNVGIAGHRDGFFRPLRSVAVGDTIQIATNNRVDAYVVDRIEIVDPEDTQVLKSRQTAELTLVTCYPFNFTGAAPRRYIVHAMSKQRSPLTTVPSTASAQPETAKEK